MKRVFLTALITCMVPTLLFSQMYRKGLPLEMVMPDDVSIYEPEEFGFGATLPSSYSMREYAPYPQNQGEYSTCVGWAFGYAATTIMYAQKFKIKNRNYISAAAMCPYTVYNDIKDSYDARCQQGTYLHLAAKLLKEKGTKRLYLDENSCGRSSEKDKMYRVFKVSSYAALWDVRLSGDIADSLKIKKAKTAISNGKPIVIAFKTTYSFCSSGVDTSGLWDKSKGLLYPTGGHAMTVIGYDDKKFGGSFEIQNSWGEEWGNHGYVYVKYDDFAKYVYGAYVMELSNIKPAASSNCLLGNCENGYGRYVFESGDVYEGEIINKKFEGMGIYQWSNGDVYAGKFKDGLKEGKGRYYFADGTLKVGYWSADTLNEGMDYLEYTYGTVKAEGAEFEGYQKADQWIYGKLTTTRTYSSEVYSGKFAANHKHGFGISRSSWGTNYVGQVSEDRFTGYFAMINPKTEYLKIYDKTVSWNKMENAPTLADTLKIPEEPVGDSVATAEKTKCVYGDCMNGYGTYKYESGNIYSGFFVNGYRHGFGKYAFMKGTDTLSFYEGMYQAGKKSGTGTCIFGPKTVFVGEFDGGRTEGMGIYVWNGKRAVAGVWEKGKYKVWEKEEFGFGEADSEKDKQGSASAVSRNNKYQPQRQNHTRIE